MIHDLPVDDEDPTIICQIDFSNAFQMQSRQLGTNDCILGVASRTYDQERVQIGDPLPHLEPLKKFEMTRFCLTVHPNWGRVLSRHSATQGAGYADDAYLMGKIKPTLLALADAVRSFKEDAYLEVCLSKCTIYMPGISKECAHQLIRDCIDTD